MENEPKIETKEKLLLNLKTNPEETLAAMRRVEPQGWKAQQEEWDKKGVGYTTQGALRWIRGEGSNDTGGSGYIVYGFGGHNRWYVGKDGSVGFSKRHGESSSLRRAEEEGFEID